MDLSKKETMTTIEEFEINLPYWLVEYMEAYPSDAKSALENHEFLLRSRTSKPPQTPLCDGYVSEELDDD